METITVKALKDFLKDIPDEFTIVLSKDAEGNSFSPMSKDVSVGIYKPETKWFGDVDFNDTEGTSIVLFPTG